MVRPRSHVADATDGGLITDDNICRGDAREQLIQRLMRSTLHIYTNEGSAPMGVGSTEVDHIWVSSAVAYATSIAGRYTFS